MPDYRKKLRELAAHHERVTASSLRARNSMIALAFANGGLKQQEIAELTGLSHSMVRHICREQGVTSGLRKS
jgi:predicted transcriptional regulator